MFPISSFKEFERRIEQSATEAESRRLVGLLFARPDLELCKQELLPSLRYYHERSGKNVNFFCMGYLCWQRGGSFPHVPDAKKVEGTLPGGPGTCIEWAFSDSVFNELRKGIEARTKWHHSGNVDLILVNAVRGSKNWPATVDYSTAIAMDLTKAKEEAAISSVPALIESICQFCENYKGDDPAWGFSDKMGAHVSKSALKALVLSLLPKNLGADARKSLHFVVRDISA